MSSAAVSTHSGAGPLSLMSCVRESSPLQDFDSDTEKNVATKKKFWNRLKWFKRKNKVIEDSVLPVSDYIATPEALRSRSTSELSIEEPPRKRTGSSMYPGLSVSHDSVFHSPHSGSETDLDVAHSSSSLCIPNQPHAELQTELSERLRLRRSGVGRGDTSEDDEGLPHSLCNSPTTTDSIDKTALKDLPNKSHSTCSDGSLLSVGSSDIDEDLPISQFKHSSKLSFTDNRHELELGTQSIPLNHSAAHHRVAVRPKKTHGVPRRKRSHQLPNTLPTTIEVNEDSSIRSSSPDSSSKVTPLDTKLNRSRSSASSKSHDTLEENIEKEKGVSFLERLFPRRSAKKKKTKHDEKKQEEKKIKLEEHFIKSDEKRSEDKRRSDEYIDGESFKSNTETLTTSYSKTSESLHRRYETKPIPAVRSGAAYRQRVLPIDIPDSPESFRREDEVGTTKNQATDMLSTSPLQMELENKLKKRLTRSSPTQSNDVMDVIPNLVDFKTDQNHEQIECPKSPTSRYFENRRSDESHMKIRLAGLSSLQQKVLTLNEDEADYHNFKSLTEFPTTPQSSSVMLTKSHSFKSSKSTALQDTSTNSISKNVFNIESTKGKSSSLDSIKLIEEQHEVVENIQKTNVQVLSHKVQSQREIKQKTIEIKCDVTVSQNDNLEEEVIKHMMETKSLHDSFLDKNHITISGPSHTAVVNVKNSEELYNISSEQTNTKIEVTERSTGKEQLISITKINVQPETDEVLVESPKIEEAKLSIKSKIPKRFSDEMRKRPVFNFEVDKQANLSRKFSKDDVEVIDKEDSEEGAKISPVFAPIYKKNEKITNKKSSVVSITPESPTRDKSITSYKSSSLTSLISDNLDSTDKSSLDSLDNIIERPSITKEKPENVVLRKKSSLKESKEDEPELMKVFARRSLKLKDPENESLSQQLSVMLNENCDKARDSDKENHSDSPIKERRRSTFRDNVKLESTGKLMDVEVEHQRNSVDDDYQDKLNENDNKETNGLRKKPLTFELEKREKEPLIESNSMKIHSRSENNSLENNDVVIRKPEIILTRHKAISMNSSNIDNSQNILRKQFISRRRTDNWITNIKNEESDKDKEIDKDEETVSEEETVATLIIEPKNFNQRKAEWEKRAQEAQKKSTP